MYTFSRQDMGLDSLVQYSESNSNPVQWIQFLRALDQPDLPGWPLITPIKVQMLKCEKCSLEFCSPTNFRRHGRTHRRSLKVNKVSHNLRGLLADLWDKCSLVERKQIVSFDGTMIKKISGPSVIEALAGALLEPGVWALPQVYLKAGSKLLDIVQARPPITSISSQELFSILDDASEGTFLCTGAAEFVQNYVFDGEAASSLEFKNLVSSTSFLFELKLVKAWVADKDAEALRCQKLLVEEEEAALKRQAKLVERKKQKKLRQKEQKLKEQPYACKQDNSYSVFQADGQVLSEESIPSSSPESGSNPGNVPADIDTWVETMLLECKETEDHFNLQLEIPDECTDHRDFETSEPLLGFNVCQSIATHCLERVSLHGFMADQYIYSKQEVFQKSNPNKDESSQKIPKVMNSKHTGSGHSRVESELLRLGDNQIKDGNCNVVIGSIFIPMNCSNIHQLHPCPVDLRKKVNVEQTILAPCASTKVVKSEAICIGSIHVASNLWKQETEVSCPSKAVVSLEVENQYFQNPSKEVDGTSLAVSDGKAPLLFSAAEAKTFLTQRWKQTLDTDQVKLKLDPDHGT